MEEYDEDAPLSDLELLIIETLMQEIVGPHYIAEPTQKK